MNSTNFKQIGQIVKNVGQRARLADPLSLMMDIDAVNDICPLDFDRMLKDLASNNTQHVDHDIVGITANFDRSNKVLLNEWRPRYGLPKGEA